MKKKLIWRLGKLPTVEELIMLINDKLITKEEAKDILFNFEDEKKEDSLESLKSEVKFLKEIIEKLSRNNPYQLYQYVQQVQPIYYRQPWYQPFVTYCSASNQKLTGGVTSGTNSINLNATSAIN